jgi:hypothetical protein
MTRAMRVLGDDDRGIVIAKAVDGADGSADSVN